MAHTHPKLLMCASVHWFQVFSLIDLPINRGNPVTIRGETVRPALTLQGQISPIRRMKPHGFPAIRPTIRKAHRRSLHFWMTTHRAWLGPAIGLAAGALGLAYTIRRWNSTRLSSALARTGLPQRSKWPARDGPFAFSKLQKLFVKDFHGACEGTEQSEIRVVILDTRFVNNFMLDFGPGVFKDTSDLNLKPLVS